MMAMDDKKKKNLAIIIASGIGKKGEGKHVEEHKPVNEAGDEVDYSAALEEAAQDIINAIDAKSAKSLKEAMESFLELHCSQEGEEDADDEAEEFGNESEEE